MTIEQETSKTEPDALSAIAPLGLARRITRRMREMGLSAIAARLAFQPEDTIAIFSSGRGGSTWLTDIARAIPKTATIWEPLSKGSTPRFEQIGFDWDQYIPLDADWPEAHATFDQLFRGKLISWPTTLYERQHGGLKSYVAADRLIVKFTGANALAPWLCRQFAFKTKPVLLLRHPMATIASRFRHGAWPNLTDKFVFPRARYSDLNDRHRDYLSTLSGLHRVHAAKWCMQHLPTLEALRCKQINVHTIYYENIVLERRRELNRLFDVWGIDLPEGIVERSKAASATTRNGSPLSGRKQLSFWRSSFTEKQINEMQEVLEYFNVKTYSKESDTQIDTA